MNKVQKKVWFLAVIVLLIMAIIWTALTFYNQKTQHQYNETLQRYLTLNEATLASQQTVTHLNDYLLQPSEENKQKLDLSKKAIGQAKSDLAELRNQDNDLTLTNYNNLLDSLIETTERSLLFQAQKELEGSAEELSEATRISTYISEMTLTLIDTELKTYDRFYRGIIEQSAELNKLGIYLLLLITLILLFLTYWFSKSITRPVQQLTEAANELAKGRFDLEIEVTSNDEISFLAKTFDRMRININNLIFEIQEKAQLERELQQNQILLQESQFQSLQNQINPHFLFNTLNLLSKKAYMEGSEETSNLLVSVADLLRYNLKRLDRPVTLQEEAFVLQQYMAIQKARFMDRLEFETAIDDSCMDVRIPGLTLQPIIENAVIHAIEPEEDGGVILFRVLNGTEAVTVIIEDSGQGMTEEKIRQVLEEEYEQTKGHSTGIGLSNVIKRLRLFYGREDIISIESRPGKGTKVILTIPKLRGGEKDDKASDR